MNNHPHLIGHIKGKHSFPTVIAFGGVHGNEPAGVIALERVINRIEKDNLHFHGNFYALKGNLKALERKVRFIDEDLNRIWTRKRIKHLYDDDVQSTEIEEQRSLFELIKDILKNSIGPFYFLDLHTTSSYTIPFITISDSLNNRKFSSNFHIPIILGIEEFLEGPILTFLNEYGHVSLGFEAGQHDESSSVNNCEFFIWKSLALTGCVNKKKVKNYFFLRKRFNYYRSSNFYHIIEKHTIAKDDKFEMEEGYTNFQPIEKGELLAHTNDVELRASDDGRIFMPLYQQLGDDGYFIIRKISKFWLGLSKMLRKTKAHQLLRLLPGIKKVSHYTLRVNPKTAVFLRNQIFHLFGYRKRVRRGRHFYYTRRDRKVSEFR